MKDFFFVFMYTASTRHVCYSPITNVIQGATTRVGLGRSGNVMATVAFDMMRV